MPDALNCSLSSFKSFWCRARDGVQIVERCVFALVNEGFKVLGDGKARSPADVDAVWVHG